MKNEIITKENGKKYWSVPYLEGVNNLGQPTRLYIPHKHPQFLIERDDRIFGLPEGDLEFTFEEVLRTNPQLRNDSAFIAVANASINTKN